MADDIQIVIGVVGENKIISATKSAINLENSVKSLSKSFNAGRISEEQFNTGLKELRKNLDSNGRAWQTNKASIDKYASGLKQLKVAQDAAADQKTWFAEQRKRTAMIQESLRLEARQAAAVAKAAADKDKAVAKEVAAIQSLKLQYNQTYAAAQSFKKQLGDLNTLHKAGGLSADQHRTKVAALKTEYRAFLNGTATGMNQFAVGANLSRSGVSQLGMATQQFGYQAGDFLVQIQSGTNWMVAFGQQATQLVGVLPMLAGTLGVSATALIGVSAVLGIVIPLVTAIGGAWMRTRESSDEASKGAKEFESALASARSEVKGMKDDLELLSSGFKETFELTFTKTIEDAEKAMKRAKEELDLLMTAAALAGSGAAGGIDLNFFGIGQSADDKVKAAKEAYFQAVLELATARELSQQEQQRARDASVVNQLHEVRQQLQENARVAMQEQLKLEQDISSWAMTNTYEKRQQAAAAMTLLQNAIEVYEVEKDIREELGDATVNALKLAGVDLTSPISSAAIEAAKLAEQMGMSFQNALAFVNTMSAAQANVNARAAAQAELSSETGSGSFVPVTLTRGQIQDAIDRANAAHRASTSSGSRGGGGSGGGSSGPSIIQQMDEYMSKLEQEIALKRQQVGLSEEASRILDLENEYKTRGVEVDHERIQALVDQEQALKAATDAENKRTSRISQFKSNMDTVFESIITGSSNVGDAIRKTFADVLLDIYKQKVIEPMTSGLMSLLGFSQGGVFQGGNVKPFATGGVVNSSTFFPMTGGKTGLMGEAGPEAIMPLKRTSSGKLGVVASGGSSSSQAVQITNNFSFAANGDDSVKRIIAEAAPTIAKAGAQLAQKQIIDAKRRGGATKAAFS